MPRELGIDTELQVLMWRDVDPVLGAPIPSDGAESSRSAYAVLDLLRPEEAFDRITRLVSALLSMPIALVSLIDGERQWFKSSVGLDVDETAEEQASAVTPSSTMSSSRFPTQRSTTALPTIRW